MQTTTLVSVYLPPSCIPVAVSCVACKGEGLEVRVQQWNDCSRHHQTMHSPFCVAKGCFHHACFYCEAHDTHAHWNLLITLSKKKLTYIGERAKNNSRQSYNFNCVQSTANVTLQSNRLKSWWSKQRSWREEEPGRVAVKPLRAVKMGKEVWHIFCSGRPSRHCSSTACSCWSTYWMFALLRICWGVWCGQYHCWPFQGGRSGTKESA